MQTYLAGSGAPVPVDDSKPRRNKLRRDERTGSVLPPPSQWNRGPLVYGHANNGLGGVGQTGYQAYGSSIAPSSSTGYGVGAGAGGAGYGTSYGTTATGFGAGASGLRTGGGGYGGGTTTTSGRLQQKIEEAKERGKERRERSKAKRRPDEISKRNLVVDADGVAHDSEYVQFRTATPLHLQKRRQAAEDNPNDDGSASSSSSEDSDGSGSGFHSSPYTYQSTHRTASTQHRPPSSSAYPPTISAIPPYLANQHRTSLDAGPSSLSVPRAPSPHRRGGGSMYDGASGHGSSYDRIGPGYGSRVTSSKLRSTSTPMHHHPTTASYQPPAPAFQQTTASYQPPAVARTGSSTISGGEAPSFIDSTALSMSGAAGGESGYNKAAKSGHGASARPPKLDGSALEAGMHGLNRSFAEFKLDMRFGAHKVGKKLTRKLNAL
ncbi:hypothetical protein Rhopal_001664-T1 [Rhodotorula paludigena]|uniref:Uncharacterized protein n=1 Tax=Rhodotorula paludigena TaxID=86838 RepID=A0AAV5GEN4_9BASI|nr:hypothetical protein Rhopal_001664-T1 [Rhodotorula paludigena]